MADLVNFRIRAVSDTQVDCSIKFIDHSYFPNPEPVAKAAVDSDTADTIAAPAIELWTVAKQWIYSLYISTTNLYGLNLRESLFNRAS